MSSSVVVRIDIGNETFQRTFKKLPNEARKAAIKTFGTFVLLDLANAPAALHLHTLKATKVPSRVRSGHQVSVYTIHLTPDDRYKASFTFEEGTAYFRVCGEHDWVDRNP